MPKCRITVLRRTIHRDLMDEYLSQERGTFDRCQAFADIHKDIMAVMFGGNYPWIGRPGTAITCCTDGLRPVIFKVERLNE